MGKDPAFLFYPGDWLCGTMGMTFEEKGAYMELLMMQFNRGHLTSQMVGQTIGQLWVKVQDKFKVDDKGLYYNERLEIEIEKRKTFIQSRFNNLSGKNQYSKKEGHKDGHKDGHKTSHKENINENEDLVKNEELLKKREDAFKLQVVIFSSGYSSEMLEKFINYWTEKNKSRTKMRWEMEKTFEIEKRLITWKNNDEKFKKNENNSGNNQRSVKRVNDLWK